MVKGWVADPELREHEMGSRRSDVDPHARKMGVRTGRNFIVIMVVMLVCDHVGIGLRSP